jgi:AraC-like DNA-binding protein
VTGAGGTPRGFYRPPPELASFAQFSFVLPEYRSNTEHDLRRVPTPRATLYFAADVREHVSGAKIGTGVFCEGPHSRGFEVKCDCSEMIAVKVKSGALGALLGVPARELRDQTVNLEDIWGRAAARLAEQMQEAGSAMERLQLLQRELSRRYLVHERENALALAAANAIERRAGRVRIADLSAGAGVGRRALLQRFDACVGLSPKQYVRITRLRSMIAALFARQSEDLSSLSIKYGFYDQSHMIHEFRDLLGVSPAAFKKELDAFTPARAPAFGRRALPKREQQLYRSLGLVSQWEELRQVPRKAPGANGDGEVAGLEDRVEAG